ncbi:MAG: ABC transporter substrate-binding protein [Spirochaetaceae bacterium]|nr:MAG: ABC transporter substrate-binding protein [Spirochaetaceae bacterium]
MKRILLVMVALLLATAVFAGGGREEQRVRQVPRNRTLITSGWDYFAQVASPDNMSPYSGPTLHLRNILHYTVFENLFYSNVLTGEIEPWIGTEWRYNDDFTQVTVTIRDDVTWSDGVPLTARDVVFSGNMLKQNAPEMPYSSQFAGDVASVTAPDDYTVVFNLTRPAPRWARNELSYALGQPARFVIVPEHIWADKNAPDFRFLDLAQGWPVGTGPYRLVLHGNDQLVFDLRDSWWAAEAGKAQMPQVERVIYRPATAEALPQLYISNQMDTGRDIPIGAFEAGRARNPNLRSWNDSGPQWGAPNGCTFRITFNTQKEPFNDPEVRWAINRALDRDSIIDLAYEGSTFTAIAPLSAFDEVQAYVDVLSDMIDEFDVNRRDLDEVAQIMERKGFQKNAAGRWADANGSVLELDIQSQQGNPMAPIISQQLRDAGFDARIDVVQGAGFIDNAHTGDFSMHLWVHCGSVYDPYQTLSHYHSNLAAPAGSSVSNLRAYTRYANPDLDELLDQMSMMVPDPNDAEYVDLVREALRIYLTDLPDITLGEERQVFTMNETYWTNWPSADNPYMHPTPPWEGYARVIHRLQPVQ